MKKIRVFDSPDDLPRERSSLLAVSNKFGLTFVGQGRALKVFLTDDIITAGRLRGNTNEIGKGEMTVWTSVASLPARCCIGHKSILT